MASAALKYPIGQVRQAAAPCNAWYLPPTQASQKPIDVDACLVPGSHSAQPVSPDVTVYWPAAQSAHESTTDVLEYLPATHGVQMLAPTLVPEFVIEPAAHTAQSLAKAEPVVST